MISLEHKKCQTPSFKVDNNVHSLRDERERKFQYKDDKRRKGPNTRDGYRQHCSKCGIKHDQNKCPAEGKTCAKCKKLNHFARMRKSKLKVKERKRQVHGVEEEESEESDSSVGTTDAINKNEWYEDVKIAKKTCKCSARYRCKV